MASQRASIPLLDQTLRQNIATLALLIGRAAGRSCRCAAAASTRSRIPRVTPGLPSELLLPAARHPLRRSAARRRRRQRRGGARRVLPEHHADRPRRLHQHRAAQRCSGRKSAFYSVAAGLTQPIFDGFRLEGQLELAQGPPGRAAAALPPGRGVRLHRRRAGADRGRRQRRARAAAAAGGRRSRRAFEIAETRLREGTVDLVTVLITQQALFKAEENLRDSTACAFAGGVEPLPGAGRRLAAARRRGPDRPTRAMSMQDAIAIVTASAS